MLLGLILNYTVCDFNLLFFFAVVGLIVPSPENLRVDILDGEAIAHWSCPTNAPADFRYNVEMAKYVKVYPPPIS